MNEPKKLLAINEAGLKGLAHEKKDKISPIPLAGFVPDRFEIADDEVRYYFADGLFYLESTTATIRLLVKRASLSRTKSSIAFYYDSSRKISRQSTFSDIETTANPVYEAKKIDRAGGDGFREAGKRELDLWLALTRPEEKFVTRGSWEELERDLRQASVLLGANSHEFSLRVTQNDSRRNWRKTRMHDMLKRVIDWYDPWGTTPANEEVHPRKATLSRTYLGNALTIQNVAREHSALCTGTAHEKAAFIRVYGNRWREITSDLHMPTGEAEEMLAEAVNNLSK